DFRSGARRSVGAVTHPRGGDVVSVRRDVQTRLCMAAAERSIVFLSDFGYRNESVRICHAVMNRIAPTSPIVDLSHGVPPLDVRGPGAGHLAAGAGLETLGPAVDPATLVGLAILEATLEPGKIECEVLDLNRFGNVQLNVREPQLAEAGLDGAGDIQVDAT